MIHTILELPNAVDLSDWLCLTVEIIILKNVLIIRNIRGKNAISGWLIVHEVWFFYVHIYLTPYSSVVRLKKTRWPYLFFVDLLCRQSGCFSFLSVEAFSWIHYYFHITDNRHRDCEKENTIGENRGGLSVGLKRASNHKEHKRFQLLHL